MQPKQPDNQVKKNRTRKLMGTIPQSQLAPFVTSPYQQALSAWPIFGGSVDAGMAAPGTPPATPPSTPEGAAAQQDAGAGDGSGGDGKEDPVQKLQSDPDAIGSLLKQMQDMQKNLEKVTGERDTYLQKQQEAARAQQTKEEQLQTDYDNAQATIEKMDRVIRETAKLNAFLSQNDFQWNSIRQAMSELQDDEYEIQVDLDGGKAEVTGMEQAVKRIAQSSPWLLKGGGSKNDDQQQRRTPQRSSGRPPSPPNGNEQKANRRAELMKKYPVLGQGRALG